MYDAPHRGRLEDGTARTRLVGRRAAERPLLAGPFSGDRGVLYCRLRGLRTVEYTLRATQGRVHSKPLARRMLLRVGGWRHLGRGSRGMGAGGAP